MPGWITTVGTLTLGCFVVLYIGLQALRSRTSLPLPPGPPGLPWIGNVIGIDTDAPWKTYAEWARTYGDLVYSRLLGKDIIIINSEKIAKDLLENRSKNYSDRPYLVVTEMCGLGFASALLPYGDRWRHHRRFFHQTFRQDAVPRFSPLQHRKACHVLRRLLDSSEGLNDHLFEYTASLILNSTYNYDPESRKDDLLDIVLNVLNIVLPAVRPDVAVLVTAFPLLLCIPSWFPGMSFKRKMETARAYSKDYLERPFEYALRKVPSDTVEPSMVYDALKGMEEKGVSPENSWMELLKETCGFSFLAAADTSHSVLMTFFLMMMLNPTVQEKAHAQIDAVVGRERLPMMDDRASLPLLDAILWETLRYNPVSPLAAPHATVDDDVYDGFHIPKGAIVLTNLWSMSQDRSRFTDPHIFMPERFLNEDGSLKPNEMEHLAFGFGRRVCAGRHFADTSVWTMIAKALAVFKILKPLDENGVEVSPEPRFSTGGIVHPLPFKCRVVPRFPDMDIEKLQALIDDSAP